MRETRAEGADSEGTAGIETARDEGGGGGESRVDATELLREKRD